MRADHAAQVVGIEVYNAAAGEPITMSLVKSVITELTGHSHGCDCGRCAAARATKPHQVFFVAKTWASAISTTKARARR